MFGAEKAPLDYMIMTPSCKSSLNGHSHNGSHEDVVPVMLEVDGPADGGGERQAEETDLDGGHNEGLGDEGVNLFVEFRVIIKRIFDPQMVKETLAWRYRMHQVAAEKA